MTIIPKTRRPIIVFSFVPFPLAIVLSVPLRTIYGF